MTETKKPKITPELLEARPGLADQPHATHPHVTSCVGQPPKRYTPGVHAHIVDLIKRGHRPVVAAGMAGIPTASFYAWMKEGREGNVHLVQFAEDVELAQHVAEGTAVEILREGFDSEDQKVAQETVKYWLGHQRADGWSKEANAKVNAMLSEFFQRLEAALPPEIFQMVISAASGQALAAEKQVFRLKPAPGESEEE